MEPPLGWRLEARHDVVHEMLEVDGVVIRLHALRVEAIVPVAELDSTGLYCGRTRQYSVARSIHDWPTWIM